MGIRYKPLSESIMQTSRLIMAKVEDGQSHAQISLPVVCTFDEHYSGETLLKAKQMAMGILHSKPAFTHVTLEPIERPELESSLKQVLKLNPNALIHQRIYNPHEAQFRGYAPLNIDGYEIKYALRTSGFCSYAVVATPEELSTEFAEHDQWMKAG